MGLLTSSRRRMALGLSLALFFILCEVLLTFRALSIIDNAPALIYAKDLQGRCLFINRRFESLFGMPCAASPGEGEPIPERLLPHLFEPFRGGTRGATTPCA